MDKAFIEKYLDGHCTAAERRLVETFLESPEGAALLDEVLTARLPQDMLSVSTAVDPQQVAAWKAALHDRLDHQTLVPARRLSFLRHAAVWIAMVVGAAGYVLFHFSKAHKAAEERSLALQEKRTAPGERAIVTLMDGSVIYLGADSKLQYPEKFTDSTRELVLTGEAFFEVKEDPLHPFIVHAGHSQTRVLGTSFKIHAFEGNTVTVSVATGKVRVDNFADSSHVLGTVLTAGQEVSWNSDNPQPAIARVAAEDISGWKNARLVFNDKTLKEITTELQRWYNVNIQFRQASLADKRITVTLYANMPLNQLMHVLGQGSNFTYSINGRNIIIH